MYPILSRFEQFSALVVLILFLPLLIPIALVIFLLSGCAPLVAHRRIGRYGEPFWMLKFRTMWNGARRPGLIERLRDDHVPEIKIGGDPRVTSRFAAFCRRHSIDELPQLWHVATGEMSFVGPRPVTPAEWDRYYGPSASEVLALKPGLSGLWQTRGRNRLTYGQRRRLDLFLARHYCLWLYVRIVAKTIPRALAGRDAW
jgi:lipopolysaccharide/colanic/teichoic acid biosynthesis glycosyltransferase